MRRKRIFTWAVIFVVLIIAFIYLLFELLPLILAENTNTLAIGQRAIVESLDIPIVPPVDLDNMTHDEIIAMRQEAVMQYPWLIYNNYEPANVVFSQIEDNKPWWGTAGWYYYGSGEMSTSGPAREALQILNPYLLVSADFSGLSIHSGQTDPFWNQNIITASALETTKFPFYITPQNLRWWPERGRVEVTYNLTEYLGLLNHWTARSYSVADASLDLIAYNARDFNMNYIWVDYTESIYISKEILPPEPFEITHFLHHTDSCGFAGGCNSMDPVTPEIQNIQVDKLPAKLILYLWRDKPASADEPASITYVINIK